MWNPDFKSLEKQSLPTPLTSTPKRDLKALDDRIEFIGVGKNGCYRLKRNIGKK
jgi:hypothetical protein